VSCHSDHAPGEVGALSWLSWNGSLTKGEGARSAAPRYAPTTMETGAKHEKLMLGARGARVVAIPATPHRISRYLVRCFFQLLVAVRIRRSRAKAGRRYLAELAGFFCSLAGYRHQRKQR
jgi:hypothetical protein